MTSRLAQMQARFQQKQMQEKEEKLLKLYENQQQRVFERVGRGSAGSNTSITSTTTITSTGGGKVRQMFDERRQKAGIDKSYPLEPIKSKTTTRASSLGGNTNKSQAAVVKATVKKTVSQVRNGKMSVTQKESYQKVQNNNYKNEAYEEHNHMVEGYDEVDGENNLIDLMKNHNLTDSLDNEELPQIGFSDNEDKPLYATGKLANVGGKLPSQQQESKPPANGLKQKNGAIKSEPKVGTKTPIAKTGTPPRSSSSVSSASSQSSRNSPARSNSKMSSNKLPAAQSAVQRAPANNRPSSRQAPKSPVIRDDLAECRFCGRRFATDRLGVHEDICGKTGKKKRKAYDATKHRVQGTELEGYVLKGPKKGARGTSSKMTAKVSAPKTNWRRTHEEFISAIRAAKQAQAHMAKGGKLADLPPPPPSSNPDYVQCPHCGRRFNEAAASRHIPKCATYDFNKPKNGQASRGRPAQR